MEPAFVFALSVTTAIVGQFLQYLWSFKPARVPGSGTPSEPLPHTALGSSACGRARSARMPALAQALISSQEPPSTFGRYVAERVKDALTVWVFVGLALCTRP